MNYTIKLMKKSIYSGILGLLIISSSYADVPHSIQALEHAVAARTHGKLGHSKKFSNHIEEAIKHATASEKAHSKTHTHVTEAIKHLKETIKHGEMGHIVSAIHAKEALKHAENSEKAHTDAHNHMSEAAKHLNESMKHSKAGHIDLVTEHTQQAINHIKSTF
jgi:glutamate mutase epsilon subunit